MYDVAYVQTMQDQAATREQSEAVCVPVPLTATPDPVWPEDEAAEAATLSRSARPPVPALEDDSEIAAVLHAITLRLPDRLTARHVEPQAKGAGEDLVPVPGFSYVEVRLPVSFSAPEHLVLRRLALSVVVGAQHGAAPVAVSMRPVSDVELAAREVGELGVDVGKLAERFLPGTGGVITAKASTTLTLPKVHARVQAAGLQSGTCTWRVADAQLGYDFKPEVVVQHPEHEAMTFSALLHVEVHKQLLGVFHKAYFKSVYPVLYEYSPGSPLLMAVDVSPQADPRLGEAGVGSRFHDLSDLPFLDVTGLGPSAGDHADDWPKSVDADALTRDIKEAFVAAADQKRVEQLLRRAAHAGDLRATRELAERLQATRPDEAEHWYGVGAASGDPEAMCEYARMVHPRDPAEAERWYQSAAARGNPRAAQELQRLHPWRSRLRVLRRGRRGDRTQG